MKKLYDLLTRVVGERLREIPVETVTPEMWKALKRLHVAERRRHVGMNGVRLFVPIEEH